MCVVQLKVPSCYIGPYYLILGQAWPLLPHYLLTLIYGSIALGLLVMFEGALILVAPS